MRRCNVSLIISSLHVVNYRINGNKIITTENFVTDLL